MPMTAPDAPLPRFHLAVPVLDPAGNALEFKAFADDTQVFAT